MEQWRKNPGKYCDVVSVYQEMEIKKTNWTKRGGIEEKKKSLQKNKCRITSVLNLKRLAISVIVILFSLSPLELASLKTNNLEKFSVK